MADTQGKFCKAEARHVKEAADEIMKAMPKKKMAEYFGHFNDLFLFLSAAEAAAPEKPNGE
jgi:hypothetical protein